MGRFLGVPWSHPPLPYTHVWAQHLPHSPSSSPLLVPLQPTGVPSPQHRGGSALPSPPQPCHLSPKLPGRGQPQVGIWEWGGKTVGLALVLTPPTPGLLPGCPLPQALGPPTCLCGHCPPGSVPAQLSPLLLLCPSLADIDECLTGSPCGPHGRCSNTKGSFRGPCADVNECLEGEFCFPHGECLNTDGSYTCLCAPGFAPAPSGTTCLGTGPRHPGTVVLPAGGWGRTQASGDHSASCGGTQTSGEQRTLHL
uniref:EGF-like domain-containing protein n=1 Tax=Chelonoidis abingdonii TaxID=106734 RepID=A0A8C0JE01_CHEAB